MSQPPYCSINSFFLDGSIKTIKADVSRKILPLLRSRPKQSRLSQRERNFVTGMRLSFQAILNLYDIDVKQNLKTLDQVRDQFHALQEIIREPQSIAGLPVNTWRALVHYGLAILDLLEGRPKSLSKNLLLMYREDPRLSRDKLAPGIYNEIFRPECADEYAWHVQQEQDIEKNGYTEEVMEGVVKAAGLFAYGLVLKKLLEYLTRNPVIGVPLAGSYRRAAIEKWKSHSPKTLRERARVEAKRLLESKLDERCRNVSTKLLSSMVFET